METRVERQGLPSSRPAELESAEPAHPPVAIPVEPELIQRQRALLRDLFQLIADRARLEPRVDVDFEKQIQENEADFDSSYQDIIVRFAADKEAVETELQATRQSIAAWYESERAAAEKELSSTRARVIGHVDADRQVAKGEFQEGRWTTTAVYEGGKSAAEKEQQEAKQRIAEALRKIKAIERDTRHYLATYRQVVESPASVADLAVPADPFPQLDRHLALASGKLQELQSLTIPRHLKGERLIVLFCILGAVAAAVAYKPLDFGILGAVAAIVAVVALALGVTGWLSLIARRQVRVICQPLYQALSAARGVCTQCEEFATGTCHRQLGEAKKRYSKEVRQTNGRYRTVLAELKQRRKEELQAASERYRRRRTAAKERRTRDWAEAARKYRRLRAEMQKRYETDSRGAQEKHASRKAELEQRHEQDWHDLVSNWQQGLERLQAEVMEIRRASEQLFLDWNPLCWARWTPPATIPPVIRFGEYQVSLAQIPNGLPRHERLQIAGTGEYDLPAFLAFPDPCSLLVEATDEGKSQAVQMLQAVMFRLLTTLPPGKVRFTIIDPVGLGRNFASFMHLADHDEALVTSRIWTESAQIDQRLADLTGHMENVIQKYLRNQFESIEEYNTHAGEVAEPYRILVVANFPFNFTYEAARRLVSIINSGPRCGVHTLITIDTKQALPQGFNIQDLEQPGVKLEWQNGRFIWQDDDFENFDLQLDGPPPDSLCTDILQIVGARALEAKRVEVPFEFVAPPAEQWWTGDSKPGISVALGRVGATKRQHLRLGQGTAQHVLIAGKTGSGKSTLLHALISNLALYYSPEEVELYLVDFKKGVEFKTYASHDLPHARVVAIESEREFGLSVLQRLDAELKQRAERFRAAGVQDLRSYRLAQPSAPMPRILLIVDEFQEFFVEEDRLAQDASLLLDRLVRQGRAFGLHVLLGSQTLGGAYTLARSTIDQMAVRIALQCSEVDAHLILSEDNSAARLLSRPGEAIYNDANGLVEGNNPFQVVWLADDRREEYLRRIQELARQRNSRPSAPQIVFEGNAPADVSKNTFLNDLLDCSTWPAAPRTCRAWLGEAIAIKDPTVGVFRAQSGNNLLVVGQYDEAALGIEATCLVSLAAQHAPEKARAKGGARFYILDGSPDDDANVGFFRELAAAVPHPLRIAGWRELPGLVQELAEEVDRRQKENDTEAPTIYFFVHGLQRFRDLRRPEDDFSFARGDDKPNPSKQFATILTEGPGMGVHTLLWCDSLNNVQRCLERATLREFEMRVLFQMSSNDSSSLIDSPVASRLGPYRAFFHSEEQGKLEKFRPYGLPTREWLAGVKERLAAKRLAE